MQQSLASRRGRLAAAGAALLVAAALVFAGSSRADAAPYSYVGTKDVYNFYACETATAVKVTVESKKTISGGQFRASGRASSFPYYSYGSWVSMTYGKLAYVTVPKDGDSYLVLRAHFTNGANATTYHYVPLGNIPNC